MLRVQLAGDTSKGSLPYNVGGTMGITYVPFQQDAPYYGGYYGDLLKLAS